MPQSLVSHHMVDAWGKLKRGKSQEQYDDHCGKILEILIYNEGERSNHELNEH